MESLVTLQTSTDAVKDLHEEAITCITNAYQLVFQRLPAILEQIIEQEIWRTKKHANFGEYALNQSTEGLSINNNDTLFLLKCAMEVNGRHAFEWGDVLREVDNSVRHYAKEKNIPIKDFDSSLHESDNKNPELDIDKTITYLPSRSRSNDGQLLKLRNTDEETYDKVVQGEMTLKEAFPKKLKKRLQPIESAKDKFMNLSKPDQLAFLAWIEQQAKLQSNTD